MAILKAKLFFTLIYHLTQLLTMDTYYTTHTSRKEGVNCVVADSTQSTPWDCGKDSSCRTLGITGRGVQHNHFRPAFLGPPNLSITCCHRNHAMSFNHRSNSLLATYTAPLLSTAGPSFQFQWHVNVHRHSNRLLLFKLLLRDSLTHGGDLRHPLRTPQSCHCRPVKRDRK